MTKCIARRFALGLLSMSMAMAGTAFAAGPFAGSVDKSDGLSTVETLIKMGNNPEYWALPGKNYAGTRFSELDQINAKNVSNLEVAWTFSTGALRGHEGSPIVIGDMMYMVTPFPNYVYAIDLDHPGRIAWKFEPEPDPAAIGVACCDTVNRGVFWADGKIFMNTLDGWVYALDADTGDVIWKAKNADPSLGQTMTNHPIVTGDNVIVGVSGGEFGVRGYITAYDIDTGERAWRWYNTGPDEQVGIFEETFDPYYDYLKGEDLGVTTWPKGQWKVGGSTVWGWFTYDPELDLVYYGTSNPGTWNASMRRKNDPKILDQLAYANRWSASVMARDPDNGKLVWAYNFTPHDEWDYDAVNEMILVDIPINGEKTPVLVHFDRNGFAYVINRKTGKLLKANEYGDGVNWAKKIDPETGLPIRNKEKGTQVGSWTKNICPSSMGYKDQAPAAYSPITGLFYVPTNNLCMNYKGVEVKYIAGAPYVGAVVKTFAGPGGHKGAFMAWDPQKEKRVWQIEHKWSNWGGAMVTAGNVVFYGTMSGWFRAVNAKTGELLWKFHTGSGIIGNPITYIGPDGDQYVAIYSGIGGWAGLTVAGDLSLDDPTGALGAVNAFAELGRYTRKGGMLYVFQLDEDQG